MIDNFWMVISEQWSTKIDLNKKESEKKLASALSDYASSNVPKELMEDDYEIDDD